MPNFLSEGAPSELAKLMVKRKKEGETSQTILDKTKLERRGNHEKKKVFPFGPQTKLGTKNLSIYRRYSGRYSGISEAN